MPGAALYMGTDSGHGVGTGSSHHPGLGGGVLPNCPHPSLSPTVVPRPVQAMNATTIWPPHPQLPAPAPHRGGGVRGPAVPVVTVLRVRHPRRDPPGQRGGVQRVGGLLRLKDPKLCLQMRAQTRLLTLAITRHALHISHVAAR